MSTFSFPADLTQMLNQLRSPSAPTPAHVLRRALVLLEVATAAQQNGERLVLTAKDGSNREIDLPPTMPRR